MRVHIFSLLLFAFCLLLLVQFSTAEDEAPVRRRPKYTEIQRPKRVRTTTEVPASALLAEIDDDDEEDSRPHISGNARGGSDIESIPDRADDTDKQESTSAKSIEDLVAGPTKTTEFAGRRYVEYSRPGSKKQRPRRPTTKAPTTVSVHEDDDDDEDEDDNKRPTGCNECRFYCKRCRGAEEVTTGGVWGCCNHNCCGGRCSCQKVKD